MNDQPSKSEKLFYSDLILTEELLQLLKLDEREKRILDMRYIDGLSLDDIGDQLNLTRERVRQIYQKCLIRIRSRIQILSTEFLLIEAFKNDIMVLEAENAHLRKKIKYYMSITPSMEIDLLDMEIQSTTLSIRAKNCLKSCKIKTLRDLIKLTESDVLGIPNIGLKTVKEIEFYISSCGLKFKA